MPSNPFQFLVDLLEPLVDSDGLLMPPVPPPQRPFPATQRDYFSQLRIDVMIEEWLYELLVERPVATVRYTFHYFRRGASARFQPEPVQEYFDVDDSTAPGDAALDRSRLSAVSPALKYGRSRSPLQPGDARLSRVSPSAPHHGSTSPISGDENDGYMGDVSPRPGSSQNISPGGQLDVRAQSLSEARSPQPPSKSPSRRRSDERSPSPNADVHKQVGAMLSSSVTVSPVSSLDASPIHHPAAPHRVKILVLVSSHERCRELAYGAIEGLHEADTFDIEPHLYRFPLTAAEHDEGLEHLGGAVEHFEDDDPRYIPFFSEVSTLPTYDGFIFVIHGRLGGRGADVHAFMDTTGGLWGSGALVGKPIATMVATFAQHSGLEFAHRHLHIALLHHGCIVVGANPQELGSQGISDIDGGSPYGAGTITGTDGARGPSPSELRFAKRHALRLAQFASKLQ